MQQKKEEPWHVTLESSNLRLKEKGLDSFISIIEIQEGILLVRDIRYGDYKTSKKNLAMCEKFPLHKKRNFENKISSLRTKYIGKKIKDVEIKDIFYGPDKGYKNASFYFVAKGICGHELTYSYATLTRHIKTFKCQQCSKSSIHGERKRVYGVLPRRTSTYTAWVSVNKKLDEKYRDFNFFRDSIGEKPYPHAHLVVVNGIPMWECKSSVVDKELNLIAGAIRQVFRRSKNYLKCQQNARVETSEGVRYQCALCKNLFKLKEVQVDHVIPIQPLDGSPLTRVELIERIWDFPIQILDKACHIKKTAEEHAIRKIGRKSK